MVSVIPADAFIKFILINELEYLSKDILT
jgi:hypothetical protein